jgi:type IV pilus assembly protein PilO
MTSNFRKLVFFVLLLGVAYVAYQYMIKPANRHLAEQKARLQAKVNKLTEFEKTAVEAKNISKQLEQLQDAIKFFESKLPPTSEIDKVLQDITVIGEKQGLKTKRVLTLKNKDNSGYVEQPLKMEVEGDFNAFYSFLLEVEKLPRIMKIRELEMKKQIKQEGEVAANFVMSIFFQNRLIAPAGQKAGIF